MIGVFIMAFGLTHVDKRGPSWNIIDVIYHNIEVIVRKMAFAMVLYRYKGPCFLEINPLDIKWNSIFVYIF